MNIFLKCPHCDHEIMVASATGVETKVAECPKCKTKMPLAEFIPKCSLKVGERCFQPRFGPQWVGRQCSTGGADVQIPDPSAYMSRRHALVHLACAPSGIVCTFEEHGKNPTQLQGIELVNDDIVYLNVNDCLKLGDIKMYLAAAYGK